LNPIARKSGGVFYFQNVLLKGHSPSKKPRHIAVAGFEGFLNPQLARPAWGLEALVDTNNETVDACRGSSSCICTCCNLPAWFFIALASRVTRHYKPVAQ